MSVASAAGGRVQREFRWPWFRWV